MGYNPEVIGDNIRALRNQRRMSQKELADDLGISAAALLNYENYTGSMSLKTACRIADYFGVALGELSGRRIFEPKTSEETTAPSA